jgi:Domain of unknown function (DUF5665)
MERIKKHITPKKKDEVEQNYEQIAKALEILFATEYIDQKKLYLYNFLRGIAFSVGGIIGATVVITILIWLLSLFDKVPILGPVIEETRQSIQQTDPN